MPTENRQLQLAIRPQGPVADDTFTMQTVPLPEVGDGQFLVKVQYLSIDPAMRSRLVDGPSYVAAQEVGQVMRGSGVGEVIDSKNAAYPVGTTVFGDVGWQNYALGEGGGRQAFRVVPPGMDGAKAISLLGGTALTAYFGMLEVGQPKAGDTVVVSGAAGATGSIAAQIAKIAGARVIGIAGSPEKCSWLTGELGLDGAIDYRNERVGRRLQELCPKGVNVFFDNVGGRILDSVLLAMQTGGRIAVCGSVSSGYNEGAKPDPISNYFLLAPRSIRMDGFLVSNYQDRYGEALEQLGTWVKEGKLKSQETIYDGLDRAPAALRDIFMGMNTGKLLVKVN